MAWGINYFQLRQVINQGYDSKGIYVYTAGTIATVKVLLKGVKSKNVNTVWCSHKFKETHTQAAAACASNYNYMHMVYIVYNAM